MFEKNEFQPVARNSHLKSACRSMLTSYLKYKVNTPGISTVSARYCVNPQESIDIDYENLVGLSNSLRYYTCLKLWVYSINWRIHQTIDIVSNQIVWGIIVGVQYKLKNSSNHWYSQ